MLYKPTLEKIDRREGVTGSNAVCDFKEDVTTTTEKEKSGGHTTYV